MLKNKILVSIVIHKQSQLVEPLIEELLGLPNAHNLKIILRVNVPEDTSNLYRFISERRFRMVFNLDQAGYGRNHNLNYEIDSCDYFIVLNPDIRLINTNFDVLTRHFESDKVGVVAPKVLSSDMLLEDSIREFPSVYALLKRYTLKKNINDNRNQFIKSKIDWCAGMFMVFSSSSFDLVNGFDTKYFMYLEDADICMRLKYLKQKSIVYEDSFSCIHNAQRASRSIFSQAFFWHLTSLIKFQYNYIHLKYKSLFL